MTMRRRRKYVVLEGDEREALRLETRGISFCGNFLFGSAVLATVGHFCQEIGVKEKNAVLINDKNTWRVAGEKFSQSLFDFGYEQVETTMVEKGAFRSEVEVAREKIRSLKPCVVFGIGGGVNMDVGKASAFLEGSRWITVPTIFSTDAMTGINATFRAEERGVDGKPHKGDYDLRVGPPKACIVDTDVIRKAPWRYQAAGFADYIAKMCAVEDWKIAYARGKDEDYSEYSVMLGLAQTEYLMKNAVRIRRMEEPAFSSFLLAMMNDGFLTQMGRSSRILFGSEHIVAQGLMEEQVRAKVRGLHGDQVAIGTILMAYLQGLDWMAVKKALEEADAPLTAKQIGLGDQAIIRTLTRAKTINESWISDRPDMYTILMERPLSEESAKEIASKTGVIES
jgi:glycerol-1-phosphate dehydrogenase [NAD(P)+]